MSELPPLDLNDFGPFFRAVHGHDPFPWQERLARQVVESGWPPLLDLPTGTGKTAALDVAVFALAVEAGRAPRSAPIRIIYVVDRRTIVDQAYKRAKWISRKLLEAPEGSLHRVRDRLARYSGEGTPLRTAVLRGGIAHDDLWARTPDQPLIAVSTVDQVGSRLLFRGYGVSDSMKPIHAGLLGCDVLYLLDEVHLSEPFRQTLASIDQYRRWAERPSPAPFVVVEMSATPGVRTRDAFCLEESDRRHPVLSARLGSAKPVSLVSTNTRAFRTEIARHVLAMMQRPGATVAVVVNRVNAARQLHQHLREVVPDGTGVHLLTGRMRPFDRDALETRLLARIQASRARSPDDQPVVVVATQTIEAGADFDFDGLVSECASLDALRQRFGRLDRLGELRGTARGVVVALASALKDDPVYGNAIGKTWEWLQSVARDQHVDFGVDALIIPDNAGERGLLARRDDAPVLLPSHLDAWVQTAPTSQPDPDVALWLHGPQSGAADVQIVWRADLTKELLTQAAGGQPHSDEAEVALGLVEAFPPVSAEAMSVPFVAAKRWLEGRSELDSFDVEGAGQVEEADLRSTLPREPRAAVLWLGEHSKVIRAADLGPGQTIVVPSSYGGIEHGNWAPASSTPVADVAELAAWKQRRRPALRLYESVVRGLFGSVVEVPKPASPDEEAFDDRQAVRDWLETRAATSDLEDLLRALVDDGKRLRVERVSLATGEAADERFVAIGRTRRVKAEDDGAVDGSVTTEESRSSFTGVTVTLAEHVWGVAGRAREFAERLGLPSDLASDLQLAGEWHDAGKADPRFQRWLHGGSQFKALVQAEPLAKSLARTSSRSAIRQARERAGYPAGGRHELMSVVLMESAKESVATRARDWPLVLHLVASHHGSCRPFAPWVPDAEPVDVSFALDGIRCNASSAHDLASFGSGVADRFWDLARKYGWWGLAWLETLVRLADHQQSEWEQVRGGERRG